VVDEPERVSALTVGRLAACSSVSPCTVKMSNQRCRPQTQHEVEPMHLLRQGRRWHLVATYDVRPGHGTRWSLPDLANRHTTKITPAWDPDPHVILVQWSLPDPANSHTTKITPGGDVEGGGWVR